MSDIDLSKLTRQVRHHIEKLEADLANAKRQLFAMTEAETEAPFEFRSEVGLAGIGDLGAPTERKLPPGSVVRFHLVPDRYVECEVEKFKDGERRLKVYVPRGYPAVRSHSGNVCSIIILDKP